MVTNQVENQVPNLSENKEGMANSLSLVNQPTSETQIVPISQSKTKKWLLPFLVLLLVLSLGVTGFFAYQNLKLNRKSPTPPPLTQVTPTPDPTSGWKTYRNTEVGYQISYPPDWELKENVNSNYLGMITISPKNATEDNTYRGSVTVWPNYSSVKAVNINIQELAKNIQQAEEGVAEYSTEEFRKIGEREFWIAKGGCCMDIGKHAFTLNKLSVYRITLHNLELAFTETENEIFNLILSTVKFTGQTNSIADWITYLDDTYNYIVQYPVNWITPGSNWTQRNGPNGEVLAFIQAGAFMNECMKETSDNKIMIENQPFRRREFKGIVSGEMCTDLTNVNLREIWIMSPKGDYGFVFRYNIATQDISKSIFDQILSSFKFVDIQPL